MLYIRCHHYSAQQPDEVGTIFYHLKRESRFKEVDYSLGHRANNVVSYNSRVDATHCSSNHQICIELL